MTNALKTLGKSCASKLIENQSPARIGNDLARASIEAATPRGGVTTPDPRPLSPTPFMILGNPEGGQ